MFLLGLGLNKQIAVPAKAGLIPPSLSNGIKAMYDTTKWLGSSSAIPDCTGYGGDMSCANFGSIPTSELSLIHFAFDGADDFGNTASNAYNDIINYAPTYGMFASFKVAAGAPYGFLLCKNTTSVLNIQYAMAYNAVNKNIELLLNGVVQGATPVNSIQEGIKYDVGFFCDTSGNLTSYINASFVANLTTYDFPLVTAATLHLGCRRGPTSSHADYFNGELFNVTIYSGFNSISSILNNRKNIMKIHGVV